MEEMKPSRPHLRGHGDASTATGRPFPQLGGCAPPQPIHWALQGNSSFLPRRKHHPVLHISAWISVRGGEFSPLNNFPPHSLHPHPSHWDVLVSSNPYTPRSTFAQAKPASSDAIWRRGGRLYPPDPSDFPCWSHGKGAMGKGGTCCGCLLLEHLYCRDLSRKSLRELHFIPYQERQLPPFLPWWILSNKDERRYWANSPPTPVKTSTTLPSPSCYHDILRCFTAWSCVWLWEEPSGI